MGKIRIKTFGDEGKEETKKDQLSVLSSPLSDSGQPVIGESDEPKTDNRKVSSYAAKKKSRHGGTGRARRSKKYQTISKQVERTRNYSLSEALDLLSRSHLTSFDETVELHINTIESGISTTLKLPHQTGKKTRVAVVTDEVLAEVEKGKIDFDVLIAHPSQMSKLAKVAKYLGPRGLMPNPKNGTVTPNPEEVVKKFEGGTTQFKTENKLPVLHLTVGKLSFGREKLTENIKTAFNAIKISNMQKVVLKSTMSPGIKLDFSNA